jgi:hypothetical protein
MECSRSGSAPADGIVGARIDEHRHSRRGGSISTMCPLARVPFVVGS